MNAKGGMKSISIDPALFKPEEREIVGDLIVAAAGDARQGREAAAEKMKSITAGCRCRRHA